MKKIFSRALLALLTLTVITACHKATSLKVNKDDVKVDRPGKADSIKVTCDANWEVVYNPYWIDVKQLNDSLLYFNVTENRTRVTRRDSITLKADSLTKVIHIMQLGAARYANIDEKPLVFKPEGEERDIMLGTDGCFVHVSCPSFIRYAVAKDRVHLIVSKNRTGDREGKIIITIDSLKRELTYSQEMLPYLKAYYKSIAESKAEAEKYDQKTILEANQEGQQEAKKADKAGKTKETTTQNGHKRGECRECHGTGVLKDPDGLELICNMCNGRGTVI